MPVLCCVQACHVLSAIMDKLGCRCMLGMQHGTDEGGLSPAPAAVLARLSDAKDDIRCQAAQLLAVILQDEANQVLDGRVHVLTIQHILEQKEVYAGIFDFVCTHGLR